MVVQNVEMPKKNNKYDNESYRKPTRGVRIKMPLAEACERGMEILATDFTEFVNEAVREKLEKMGLWPPKEGAEEE